MTNPTPDSTVHLGGKIISDRVVAQLLQEMRTGRWAGADRLPAELDLADELGVSRTVIRDALSTLERAGYVERVRASAPWSTGRCWPCAAAWTRSWSITP